MSIEQIVVTVLGFVTPWLIQLFKQNGWEPSKTQARLTLFGISIAIALIAHAVAKSWDIQDIFVSVFLVLSTAQTTYALLVKEVWPTE